MTRVYSQKHVKLQNLDRRVSRHDLEKSAFLRDRYIKSDDHSQNNGRIYILYHISRYCHSKPRLNGTLYCIAVLCDSSRDSDSSPDSSPFFWWLGLESIFFYFDSDSDSEIVTRDSGRVTPLISTSHARVQAVSMSLKCMYMYFEIYGQWKLKIWFIKRIHLKYW